MECRAYAIRMDSQSGEHLGKDRKVSSAAGGNLSGMHKTEKTVKESRMNYMYSHLCDGTLETIRLPSGLQASPFTIPSWPRKVLSGLWDDGLQSLTVRSQLAEASSSPVGFQATQVTASSWAKLRSGGPLGARTSQTFTIRS